MAALVVPVVSVSLFPDWTSSGAGMLIWLTVLIPAFLLAYYRGLQGVAVALAGGMAVITASQLSLVIFEIADPNWALLAAIVGTYLAVSVGIAALSEILRRERYAAEALALIDRLTGLPNRRHVEDTLEREFAAAERGRGLSVVIFDLDHFKRINDKHGHAAGDQTLREFAKVLEANTRRENFAGRFGGEEFVAVLRDSDADAAYVFAQRVLDQLRERRLPWGVQTVSAGIAHYQKGMGSYEVLLGEADRALYQAKNGGRDLVCVAAPLAALSRPTSATESVSVDAAPVTARIWIVDDDESVRRLVKQMLVTQGHEMWDTADATEAVRRYTTLPSHQRPDLIITDVIMPVMTGMRMIDQIALVEPRLRVIYMSGYVQSMIVWQGPPATVVDFLEKPLEPSVLLAAVQRMLRRGPVTN